MNRTHFIDSRAAVRSVDSGVAGLARLLAGLLLTMLLCIVAGHASAAPPAAGTPIGNQASATFADSTGTTRIATSNTVQTIVQQVGSLALVTSQAKTAVAGSTVYYPQTLTNSGNGTDTFTLSATNLGIFLMTDVSIFADNGSGQPTGSAITSSGAVAAGGSFRFVVVGTLPTVAVTGTTNNIAVTATSTFDGTKTASVTDVTTVSANAVVNLTKSLSAASGYVNGGPYVYTLTYINTGNATATSVRLTDAMPSGMVYVAGSARWSVTGATALTDATGDTQGTAPNTIDFSVTGSTLSAVVSQVAAGQSASVTFNVTVSGGAVPGVVNNTATLQYVDGGGTTVTGTSNTVPFTILPTGGVTITAPSPIATGIAGSSVSFSNVITNTGNATDTFDVAVANATVAGFPAGTTFLLFRADGVTPLVDSNGDGIPDTGPLAAGASTTVVMKAILPASTSGGPFNANITATSVTKATTTATAVDTVLAVTGATVDLTNNSPSGPGLGAGPEASAVVTNTLSPGSSTVFALVVNNTSNLIDAYNLSQSQVAGFTSNALPTGWTVTYQVDLSSNCSSLGPVIVNSGPIAAGSSARVCATITIPSTGAGALAGNTEVYFRAQSSATGAVDTLHDRVTVAAARSLAFTPNNAGQAGPRGSVVYSHTLSNNGNATEGNGTLSTIRITSVDTRAGFTSAQYYDANGNGVLDASDPQVPTAGLQAIPALANGLAPGQSITIFDKVYVPSGSNAGDLDATTITVTTTNGTGSGTAPAAVTATDATTVVLGNLTLIKEQALDVTCTGAAPSYTQGNITTGAVPNACLRYRVTITNIGLASASSVVVSDATPVYTLYDTGGGAAPAAVTVGTVTAPSNGTAGTVVATVGTLAPGASAILTFGVRIQP